MPDLAIDPTLLRIAALYVPLSLLSTLWLWRRPEPRMLAGLLLAFCWNLPALFAVHLLAQATGWWTFAVGEPAAMGFPVDLYLGWALLWGPLPLLAFGRTPVAVVVAAGVMLDIMAMPQLTPLLTRGEHWWLGEALAVAICLAPAYQLGRWTAEGHCLTGRVALQAVGSSALMFGLIPLLVLDHFGGNLWAVFDRPAWQLTLAAHAVAVPALLGYTAALEFARRGLGTPLPFDPPQRLVTGGPYAYLRSPMQTAAALGYVVLAVVLECPWLLLGAVNIVAYGAGLAGVTEDADMRTRFGQAWDAYRAAVPAWAPRWRPYSAPGVAAMLYVAAGCDLCSELGGWLRRLQPMNLQFTAAEEHPGGPPARLTYDPGDGTAEERGVMAVARALEHVNLAWAAAAWVLRFPGVAHVLQVVVDASGGGPRVLDCRTEPAPLETPAAERPLMGRRP